MEGSVKAAPSGITGRIVLLSRTDDKHMAYPRGQKGAAIRRAASLVSSLAAERRTARVSCEHREPCSP